MALSVALQLPAPVLTMYVIDKVLPFHSIPILNQVIILLVALVFLRHIFTYLNETATLHLKELIIFEVQERLISHIQRLPLWFFTDKQSTYLQSRVMSDSRAIEGVLVKSVVSLAINILIFLTGLIFVFVVRSQIALLMLLFLIPFGLVRYYTNERMRILGKDLQETTARASAFVAESFAGVRVIKSYVQETFQEELIATRLDALRKINVRINLFGVLSTVGTSLLTALSAALVLWYGSKQVIANHMTLGEVIAVLSMFTFFYQPINEFVATNLRVQQSASAIRRIYEFLALPQERQTGEAMSGKFDGRIELRNVSFCYEPSRDVLKNISFTIEAGKHVALVGKSGAGKSTLVNLLLGFYQPREGEVRVDGKNIESVSLASLRQNIGIVDQNTFLFSGSVLDNARLGKPEATMEEVIDACRFSYADEFISQLPDGYHTLVGERGLRLSGGQCQRIALARMFLKDPSILVLDEAVSSIDSESESYIQQAIRRLTADRTTIIIAHRLSSVLLADDVIVLEDGRIVEEGSHRVLLASNQSYARLFREQFEPAVNDRNMAEVSNQ
jgi:ABC-type bacteriocin/lantibiotic exporter with double-glycine peptidase domain